MKAWSRSRSLAFAIVSVVAVVIASGLPSAAQSPAPEGQRSLCLLTLDELSDLTGLRFVTMAAGEANCTYDGDPAEDLFTIDLRIEPPDPTAMEIPDDSLIVTRMTVRDGRDVSVGGFPAWLSPDGIWVDIGTDVFVAQPILFFAADPPTAETFLPQVAELAITRLPEGTSAGGSTP